MGDSSLLKADGVSKRYGGVHALTDVHFEVAAGEIVALVGENGAGKSTLMKVLSGVIPANGFDGQIFVNNKPESFQNVYTAEKTGIVLVPQELRIAPNLTVAENMFIGRLPQKNGLIQFDSLSDLTNHWLKLFDLNADPFGAAGGLSTSEQRMMMIAGALSQDAKVLLLDEPTAALTESEAQQLFGHIQKLKEQGLGIVVITHRLDEVEALADRVVVMRNGKVVEHLDSASGRRREIVRAMIGRDLEEATPRKLTTKGTKRLFQINGLNVEDPDVPGKLRVEDAHLTVQAGEIHGLYGLVGAGRTELARSLFGDWPGPVWGDMQLAGQRGLPKTPAEAISKGMALLTEDRKATGIFEGHSISTNMSAASLRSISRWGIIDDSKEFSRNETMMQTLDIRPFDLEYAINALSGGNQQKVLFARWLNSQPKLLILDEPTLGVDIGARFHIYETIRNLADEGLGILFISSDVDEVAAECDRVTVMYKGRMVREFQTDRTRGQLVAAATGGE